MYKKTCKQRIKKWSLYKKLYKESKNVENININFIINVLNNTDFENLRVFIFIILYYENINNVVLLKGRCIAKTKYSLKIGKFPEDLLKIITIFCERCEGN